MFGSKGFQAGSPATRTLARLDRGGGLKEGQKCPGGPLAGEEDGQPPGGETGRRRRRRNGGRRMKGPMVERQKPEVGR